MIEANWLAFAVALVLGLLVAWWLFGRATRAARLRERERRPDVLDEGAAPARRNQALIDAPPAAATAAAFGGTGPAIMGGIGEIAAAAAASEIADARLPESPAEANSPAQVPAQADDLRRIKGIGPKLVGLLSGLGVTQYAQIAGWSDADIDRIDAQLGPFAGRIRRDNWVDQARLLSAGDDAGFEARFGKL